MTNILYLLSNTHLYDFSRVSQRKNDTIKTSENRIITKLTSKTIRWENAQKIIIKVKKSLCLFSDIYLALLNFFYYLLKSILTKAFVERYLTIWSIKSEWNFSKRNSNVQHCIPMHLLTAAILWHAISFVKLPKTYM